MTNKPEVKRYTPAYGVDSVMRGHLFMEECERGAWVSLADHEALQAECEKLRRDAERYRWIRLQVGVQLTGSQIYPASPYLLVSPPARESLAESTDFAIDATIQGEQK